MMLSLFATLLSVTFAHSPVPALGGLLYTMAYPTCPGIWNEGSYCYQSTDGAATWGASCDCGVNCWNNFASRTTSGNFPPGVSTIQDCYDKATGSKCHCGSSTTYFVATTKQPTKKPTKQPTKQPTNAPAPSACFAKQFTGKWPHCSNIECTSGVTLDSMKASCDSNAQCNGFSWPSGATTGGGCLKKNCGAAQMASGGYGSGSHDYWVPCSSCFEKKYTSKWPHCTNIKCTSGVTFDSMKSDCSGDANCAGFSWPSGGPATGGGCLKKCNGGEHGGYGSGSHDYYVQCGNAVATGLDMTKLLMERLIRAMAKVVVGEDLDSLL